MSVSLAWYPFIAVPGRPVRVVCSCTVGNYAKVYLTAAPEKSEWYAKLQEQGANSILIWQGTENTPWEFTPDAAGTFVMSGYDISKGATSHGGRQLGDPNGFQSEVVNGAIASTPILCAACLELPVGAGKDLATLRWYMEGGLCRATTMTEHGEVTPAIVRPQTERIANAARTTTVQAAVAGMAGQTYTILAGVAAGYLDGILDNIITRQRAHLASAVFHNVPDADNLTTIGYQSVNNPERMQEAVGQALADFDFHMRNDNGGGTGTAQYHVNAAAGQPITDWSDALLWKQVGSQAEAAIGVVDLWRAYELHRTRWLAAPAGELVHLANDATALTAIPANSIFAVHFAVLTELAKTNPVGPATGEEGAVRLCAELGATEV